MQSSLRERLTYWLLGPLLLLVAAGTFVSYRIALNAANKAYDAALLDPVLAIASHLRHNGDELELDLPSIAIEALRIDTEDRVYYAGSVPVASRSPARRACRRRPSCCARESTPSTTPSWRVSACASPRAR
jgi:hypothetical protein